MRVTHGIPENGCKMVANSQYSNYLTVSAVCALVASSVLLFFGTGPHPVCWLTWVAPLPVLLIAAHVRGLPAFAIATMSWFIGSLNMWHYFGPLLEMPTSVAFLVLLAPSFIFGIAVLIHRHLIRRGALSQAAFAVPTVWVLYEYISSVLSPHRTLGNLAYTQMGCLLVLRLASAISLWGVSFCLFLLPSTAAALFSTRGNKMQLLKALGVLGAIFLMAVAAHLVSRFREIQLTTNQEMPDYRQIFDRTTVMIPMRDGVRLYTEIYTPRQRPPQRMPFLMERMVYTLESDTIRYTPNLADFAEMFSDKYIFVFQEIRGRYSSEGQFVMFRPLRDRTDPTAIDETTDTSDTIDWLLKNVPDNNGRVGLFGISYGGWLVTMALLDPHPALKAISEQGAPADQFLGDDFHRNGAFRLSYGFEFSAAMEPSKTSFSFPFDKHDMFDWYLSLGPLSNINALYVHGKLPTWNNFVTHPNYDEFWTKRAFHPYLSELKTVVPVLNVAGWWDPEALYGPSKIYEDLEAHDIDRKNCLVIGPWNHAGWMHTHGTKLSVVNLGSDTGAFFRRNIQAPWFAYWLYGTGSLPVKEAMIFETGSNQWKSYDTWPPQTGITRRQLYFHAHGQLSFDPPPETDGAFDSYISDPANPVPYRQRPIEVTYSTGSRWHTWLLQDQRFAQGRSDVLTWSTPPLMENLTVSGDIAAHLFASTSGTDSDWVVKLIDAYPENYSEDPKLQGYELIISDEVLRGRFRESFENPKPLEPNQVTPITIDLHSNDHTFLKGHRILVQVQSTWFPVIDRNPQKYMPNIFVATAADYQKATQQIYRSQQYPSNVEIPVCVR
jgi:putative CocE/NonD family hydrolase